MPHKHAQTNTHKDPKQAETNYKKYQQTNTINKKNINNNKTETKQQ